MDPVRRRTWRGLCAGGQPIRSDEVKDVTDAERDEAWKRITAAARKFSVVVQEKDWRELGKPKSQ
jgi:hypothetical protein